jgi:hypothetical protein
MRTRFRTFQALPTDACHSSKAKAMQVGAPQNDRFLFVSEDESDMRGIKHGWYAIEDDGDLSSGPFSSHGECLSRIIQPTNGTI